MRYAADMSKVAARHPGGRDKIRSTVDAKVPQAVGNSSESMEELMEGVNGSLLDCPRAGPGQGRHIFADPDPDPEGQGQANAGPGPDPP